MLGQVGGADPVQLEISRFCKTGSDQTSGLKYPERKSSCLLQTASVLEAIS